jgi:hypothetical protein
VKVHLQGCSSDYGALRDETKAFVRTGRDYLITIGTDLDPGEKLGIFTNKTQVPGLSA